jgi:hypothetical protein
MSICYLQVQTNVHQQHRSEVRKQYLGSTPVNLIDPGLPPSYAKQVLTTYVISWGRPCSRYQHGKDRRVIVYLGVHGRRADACMLRALII